MNGLHARLNSILMDLEEQRRQFRHSQQATYERLLNHSLSSNTPPPIAPSLLSSIPVDPFKESELFNENENDLIIPYQVPTTRGQLQDQMWNILKTTNYTRNYRTLEQNLDDAVFLTSVLMFFIVMFLLMVISVACFICISEKRFHQRQKQQKADYTSTETIASNPRV